MVEVCKLCFRLLCAAVLGGALYAAGAGAQGLPSGTAHSVTLTWVAPSPVGGSGTIGGYNVYRSPSSTTSYAKLNTAANSGLTYTDSSVSAGSSYNYCVTTVDTLGEESACSAPVTANVPSDPNAPGGLVVTAK